MMIRSGLRVMIRRRGEQAGYRVWLRTLSDAPPVTWCWRAGCREQDIIRVAGWKSTAMRKRDTADLAEERVRAAHASKSPGDRLW